MLPERQITRLNYEAGRDALVVNAEAGGGPDKARAHVPATLLLDANGFLVGVDVDPDGARLVLMAGPHEAVTKTVAISVETTREGVRIEKARALARGDEKNPYV